MGRGGERGGGGAYSLFQQRFPGGDINIIVSAIFGREGWGLTEERGAPHKCARRMLTTTFLDGMNGCLRDPKSYDTEKYFVFYVVMEIYGAFSIF